MIKAALIRLNFILALLTNAYSQFDYPCETNIFEVPQDRLMINDDTNEIYGIQGKRYSAYDYDIRKSRKPELKYKASFDSSLDLEYEWGVGLTNNTVIEGFKNKIGLFMPDESKKDFGVTRFIITREGCSAANKETKPEDTAKTYHQKMTGLLFALCDLMRRKKVIALKRDVQNIQLISFDSLPNVEIMTLKEDQDGATHSLNMWSIIKQNTKVRTVKTQEKIYLTYTSKLKTVSVPNFLSKFLQDVKMMVRHKDDKNEYFLLVKNLFTYVYTGEKTINFLSEAMNKLALDQNVFDMTLPDYTDLFPNTYWVGCSPHVCVFADMDVIMNLDTNDNDGRMVIILGRFYYELTLDSGNSTAPRFSPPPIRYDYVKKLMNSLIKEKNKAKIEKNLLNEFEELQFCDAADHFIIDLDRDLMFFVKDNFVYQLINKNSTGEQTLTKVELLKFFSDKIKDSYVQSVFLMPKKRFVVMMGDYLREYSYANFDEMGIEDVTEQHLEFKTFGQISSSVNYRKHVYIFTKQHVQVFPETDFGPQTPKLTNPNFLKCEYQESHTVDNKEPTQEQYGEKTHNSRLVLDINELNGDTFSNKTKKFIIILASLLSFLLVSTLYFTYKINARPEPVKERSISMNLSNLFNLDKSSTDDGNTDVFKDKELKLKSQFSPALGQSIDKISDLQSEILSTTRPMVLKNETRTFSRMLPAGTSTALSKGESYLRSGTPAKLDTTSIIG